MLGAKFEDSFMALKATIYKADLNIANMDDHQYGDYQLTMALHPSETIERLMVRILAYARFADEALEFTKDLFETGEPALWQKDLTGQLMKWIEVGSPDEDKDDFAGGYFISEADLSRSIADIAIRILHGTRADQIPVQSGGQPHAYLNYEQLVKHGISKNLLQYVPV